MPSQSDSSRSHSDLDSELGPAHTVLCGETAAHSLFDDGSGHGKASFVGSFPSISGSMPVKESLHTFRRDSTRIVGDGDDRLTTFGKGADCNQDFLRLAIGNRVTKVGNDIEQYL